MKNPREVLMVEGEARILICFSIGENVKRNAGTREMVAVNVRCIQCCMGLCSSRGVLEDWLAPMAHHRLSSPSISWLLQGS